MSYPRQLNRGDAITAEWLNSLLAESKKNVLLPSNGLLISRLDNGTTATPVFQPVGGGGTDIYPSFYVYADSDTTIKITGGSLKTLTSEPYDAASLAESNSIAPADGDFVWIEMQGVATWGFNLGSNFPTDKLFILLYSGIEVDEDGIVSVPLGGYNWRGGNIILPDRISVLLTPDGGDAGNKDTLCSYTYTATTLAGTQIATLLTPENSPARIYKWACNPATKGTAYINYPVGDIKLWDCNETQNMEWQASRVEDCTKTFCESVSECA